MLLMIMMTDDDNNKLIRGYIKNKLASIIILISTMLSPSLGFKGRLNKMDTETCSLGAYNCGSTHVCYTHIY